MPQKLRLKGLMTVGNGHFATRKTSRGLLDKPRTYLPFRVVALDVQHLARPKGSLRLAK